MTLTPDPPLLHLRGIRKSFGAVQALVDVDFEVRAGEVVGLVGDNGAGKSTRVKDIAGIFPFDAGEYVFEGKTQIIRDPQDVSRLGIEAVYQDLALCDNLDVVLRLGRNGGNFDTHTTSHDQIITAITGSKFGCEEEFTERTRAG